MAKKQANSTTTQKNSVNGPEKPVAGDFKKAAFDVREVESFRLGILKRNPWDVERALDAGVSMDIQIRNLHPLQILLADADVKALIYSDKNPSGLSQIQYEDRTSCIVNMLLSRGV